ncbi:MAG: carboxypeptidase regulatory-like domain-containing protein [Lachnospiraceae bacterium]|nr:carboxypeptidase regulatory-like domain-containing protein [Lachnospiraceae bacterium]
MKTISLPSNCTIVKKCLTMFLLCLCFLSVSLLSCQPSRAKTKGKKIAFRKKTSSLTVGKKYRYHIKNLPKKAKVTYSCNHKKYASIHKKKGILTAKKQGKVTVKAKVTVSGKKKKVLKTNVRILSKKKNPSAFAAENNSDNVSSQTKNNPLANTTLTVSNAIHPWNHSLVLYSSRILLESEVKGSQLTLTKSSGNTDEKEGLSLSVKVNFWSLSEDGKKITYVLSPGNAAKLCPGDGTANGNYTITSSLFSGKLSTSYRERLTPNEVRGFVFDTSRNPLSGVCVSLFQNGDDDDATLIQSMRTDEKGSYSFTGMPNGDYYILVSGGSGADSSLKSSPGESDSADTASSGSENTSYMNCVSKPFSLNESIHCENFSVKREQPVMMCKITDSNNNPLSGISVLVSKKDSSLCWQGSTDEQGLFVLSRQTFSSSDGYTKVDYNKDIKKPEFISGTLPTPEISSQITESDFTSDDSYEISILPDDGEDNSLTENEVNNESFPYESMSFTYSPKDSLTEQTLFQVALNSLPVLYSDSLSIKWDNTKSSSENTDIQASLPAIKFLKVSLYHTDGCIIFSDSCPIAITPSTSPQTIAAAVNNLFRIQNVHIADGKYYFMIQAYETSESPCSTPFISSVTIQNGILSPIVATLHSGVSAKIILCGDFDLDHVSPLPCILYELVDSTWIPVTALQSTEFEMATKNYCKAYINCSYVEPNHTYLLKSMGDTIRLVGSCKFTIAEDTLSSDPPENTVPSFQFSCSLSPSPSLTQNHVHTSCNITPDKEYFLTATNIKNCVYVFYFENGTICSTFLTNETDAVTFLPETDYASFYDKLPSGKSLKTSQPSYCSSEFFITFDT